MADVLPDRPAPVSAMAAVLRDAARGLHAQPDHNALLRWLVAASCQLTGATSAAVWVARPGLPPVWAATGSADLSRLGDPRRHPLLLAAVRGDSTVRCDDLGELSGRDQALQRATPGVRSLVAATLTRRDDVPFGILLAGSPDPAAFPDEVLAGFVALAAHAGVAIENRSALAELDRAQNEQRIMVRELQSAVRPPTPEVPNTELGVFYESADEESPSGGDLWDWLILPGGDLHFAIVDVMGKGVEATKDALAVTHALRLLALDGCALEVLVQRADSIVTAQNPDLVATLLVGRYDPETGAVRIAGAGHPPALIVGPAGCREVVAPGIPIGWPGAGSSGSVATHLDRSESLILYTDGLIEARRDIIEGLDTLKRFAVETSPYPAAQQARVLVDRVLSDAARRDDSLAVILRRRTPPIGTTVIALGPFAHRLARSDATVPMARRLLEDWLRAVPVEGTAIDDLLLTASELCANAVKHSQWTSGGAVIRAWTEGGDVVISVEDDGVGLELPYLEHEPPPRDAERGRGLWLVQTLMDDVNVDAAAGHTVVTVRKRAVAAAPS